MSEKPTKDVENHDDTTLKDDEISTEREVGRRSVLSIIGTTVLGAVAAATGGCIVATTPAYGRVRTGITDRDAGAGSDPAGYGRGGRVVMYQASGITDGDSGYNSDPGGNGRGAPTGAYTGITDGDSGHYSDPGGAGRGPVRR